MTGKLFLCDTAELAENQSKGFNLPDHTRDPALFVIRHDNQFYAYANTCPHTGAPLNWLAEQFMDMDNEYLQCSVHGALFRIQDGHCLRGPCVNQSLRKINLVIENSKIYMQSD